MPTEPEWLVLALLGLSIAATSVAKTETAAAEPTSTPPVAPVLISPIAQRHKRARSAEQPLSTATPPIEESTKKSSKLKLTGTKTGTS